jgi:hypothetical protein
MTPDNRQHHPVRLLLLSQTENEHQKKAKNGGKVGLDNKLL